MFKHTFFEIGIKHIETLLTCFLCSLYNLSIFNLKNLPDWPNSVLSLCSPLLLLPIKPQILCNNWNRKLKMVFMMWGPELFPFCVFLFPQRTQRKCVSWFEVHLFLVWYQVSNLSSGREDKKQRRYLLGYCYFVKHFKSPTSNLLSSTVISRFKIQYQVRHRHKGSFCFIDPNLNQHLTGDTRIFEFMATFLESIPPFQCTEFITWFILLKHFWIIYLSWHPPRCFYGQ